jgi:anthranilate synthase/aminodeoxychorismate synthase-like glutamine amidotransferase
MNQMILIIDNYDSFVYNLAQYIGELGWEPAVFRNNRITLEEIAGLRPSHIIISPGPRTPLESGISNAVIVQFAGKVPILGVCLGHQCIGYVYGGGIVRSPIPTHGKSSLIYHDGKTIFTGITNPLVGGRYHSLIVEGTRDMEELEITARTPEGMIMGIRHRKYTVEGVQFHPESIMTEVGQALLSNFLKNDNPVRMEG